jgi:hypothetical protein
MKAALFLLPLLGFFAARAGAAGTEAAPFLKIDSGARAAAMGGAFTAIADDASGIFYNPAGAALTKSAEILLSHNQWIEGLSTDQIAYAQPAAEDLTYFAGVSALISPMMPAYDSGGNKTGEFSAVDAMYGGGLAVIESGVIAGCFGKAVTQEARGIKASAYTGDIGLITSGDRFRIGAAAQNLGGKIKMYREESELPRIYRAGAAYKISGRHWLSGEVRKLGEADLSYAAGAEIRFDMAAAAAAFIRLGYNSGRPRNTGPGLSAGLGLSLLKLSLDYAFLPFGDFGDTHRVSLALRFGSERGPAAVSVQRTESREPPPVMNETHPFPAYEEKTAPPVPAGSYESYMTAAEEALGRNELDKAFALYGKASESIAPEDKRQTRILERQGLILIKQNNCARAKRFYSAAIRTAKKHNLRGRDVAGAYSGLAYCQEKSGDPGWAAANYRAAINATDDAALKAELQKRLAALKK